MSKYDPPIAKLVLFALDYLNWFINNRPFTGYTEDNKNVRKYVYVAVMLTTYKVEVTSAGYSIQLISKQRKI